jgi:AcrR family transcriptional regulator
MLVVMTSIEGTLPARDRILAAAARLFYRDGLRATGVDRIIAESGVAKMSFYRHFPAKADLIRAFLDHRHDYWMGWLRERVERDFGRRGLAALADALQEWFEEPGFRGCAFINAVAEGGDAGRDVAVRHKDELARYVEELAARLGRRDAKVIAAKAMILIEGAIVRAQMGFAAEAGPLLREMLQDLQDAPA